MMNLGGICEEAFAWVSVDPSKGEHVPYSTDANLRLESALRRGVDEASVLVTQAAAVLLVRVLLHPDGRCVQVTSSGGERDVLRLSGEALQSSGLAPVTCKRVVWTSFDPVHGALIPYGLAVAQRIEDAFAANRESVFLEVQTPSGSLPATIGFSTRDHHHQRTAAGFRDVFRHLLDEGTDHLVAWRYCQPEDESIGSGRFRLSSQEVEGAEMVTCDVSNRNSVALGGITGFPNLSAQAAEAVSLLGLSEEILERYRTRLTSEGLRLAARALYISLDLPENYGAPLDRHLSAVVAAWEDSGAVSEDGLGPPCVAEPQEEAPCQDRRHSRRESRVRSQAAAAVLVILDPQWWHAVPPGGGRPVLALAASGGGRAEPTGERAASGQLSRH
jgi:hypothetical protein